MILILLKLKLKLKVLIRSIEILHLCLKRVKIILEFRITRIIVFFSPSGTLKMLGNGSRNSELCLVSGKLVLRVRDTIVLKLELAHSFVIYQLQLFGQLE